MGGNAARQPELSAALSATSASTTSASGSAATTSAPDGRGYPRGLAGDEIPLEARIVAVIDAYTAMRCDRPYRAARSHQDACDELERCAGSQFDARVVKAFLSVAAQRGRARALATA